MNKLLFIFTLFFTLLTSNAKSEYCWIKEFACKGGTGYVFIPNTQLWETNKEYIEHDGKKYFFSSEYRPIFKSVGLPKIGDEVALNSTTPLFGKEEINENIDMFKKYKTGIRDISEGFYVPAYDHYEIGFTFIGRNGDYPMQIGAKLKILGYETFSHGGFLGLFADKYLFAKVEVLDDGEYKF